MNRPFTVAFSNRDRSGNTLVLEQADWGDTGRVTKLELAKAIYDFVNGTGNKLGVVCGLNDDYSYNSIVYVYTSPSELFFDIGLTNGKMFGRVIQEVEVTEIVNFLLTSTEALKYPASEILSYSWLPDTPMVYTSDGENVVPLPTLTVTGDSVESSCLVYGSCKIVYKTVRSMYKIMVPPRIQEDSGNTYDAVVWAKWDYGVQLLKLNPPESAESSYNNSTNCYFGSRVPITPPELSIPKAVPIDMYEEIDYCSQEERA